jgi:trehalose 6-phosphate phosphatase
MRYLFSTATQPVWGLLAAERTLCAFDFDGTLAPIVERPELAAMRERTRELLRRVAAVYPCVVISGRSREDLAAKLVGVDVAGMVGNHGADGVVETGEWRRVMEAGVAGMDGVWVEDKGASLAVHYRQYAAKAEARKRIANVAAGLEGARVYGGKEVVNIVGEDAPHKGTALAAERERLGCEWVLFVGDDDNDEDAFGLGGNTVPVRVGERVRSKARYYVKDQTEVDRLLERLAALRERVG